MKHRRFHPPAHAAAAKGRLSPRRERLVYAGFAALWLSGAGWLIVRYFLRATSEFGELPHPAEAWWLCLHGAAAFFALWLLGVLWPTHVLPAWKSRRRASGIVLGVIALWLVVSGFLLYYVGAERARMLIALIHWSVGLVIPLPFLWHALRGRHAQIPRSES
ncbi:MAG TPA: hypothetical protein VGC55_03990 [Dokdonella sp.]